MSALRSYGSVLVGLLLFVGPEAFAQPGSQGSRGRPAGEVSAPSNDAGDLQAAQAGYRRSLDDFVRARALDTETRATFASLTERITQLKQARANEQYAGDSELSELLKRSVDAEQSISRAREQLDTAQHELEKQADRYSQALREAIEAEKPRLASGSLSDRRNAAQKLLALKQQRTDLANTLAKFSSAASQPTIRGGLVVEAGPLDGPSELEEKADWVDFTRRKILAKLREMEAKAEEARTEVELRQDFVAFKTDVDHFDEGLRADRVARQSSALSATTFGTKTNEGSGSPTTAEAFEDSTTPATGTPGAAGEIGGVGTGNTEGTGSTSGTRGDTTTGGASSTTFAPVFSPAPVARDLTPEFALGLDPNRSDLAKDPKKLRVWIEALMALDKRLAKQANDLRARAKLLEQNESRKNPRP